MSEQETISALTKSVTDLDSSRRVGWAKSYEASERLDQALRELNMMRSERDIMRRALSFLYGFADALASDEGLSSVRDAMSKEREKVGAILDPKVKYRGLRTAERAMAKDEERMQRRADRKAYRQEKAKGGELLWKNARGAERRALADRYGFKTEAALMEFLDQHAKHDA